MKIQLDIFSGERTRLACRIRRPAGYVLLFSFFATHCLSQPQEAWIARYNGGFSNKTHTPLAMALDYTGNIYVAGSSQNASGDNDYVVLKYAPNGTQLFAARYNSTNGASDAVKGFALGNNGNSLVTGSGGTVKFNANGTVAWVASYSGNDVAVDTNGNVYVTGFSQYDFATVKLNSNGSNVWVRTYAKIGEKDESQKVAVDNAGNVYVAGWETWQVYYIGGQPDPYYYYQAAMLKYDGGGNVMWTDAGYYNPLSWGETREVALDNQGNIFVAVNSTDAHVAKINATGMIAWGQYIGTPPPLVAGIASDASRNVYVAGGAYLSAKLASTNGQVIWGVYHSGSGVDAKGIALDNSVNVYVTGVSTNATTHNDFATLKYDNDGNQLWVKRYNGPANGNDGATAIAVAPDGSIYVTGYSANTNGGVDITTIKYGVLTNVQKKLTVPSNSNSPAHRA